MLTVGIGEIQKNTSIFNNIKEAFEVVDKRKNKKLATVYPYHNSSVIEKLAGKYKNRIATTDDFNEIKRNAYEEAMREKYGLTN